PPHFDEIIRTVAVLQRIQGTDGSLQFADGTETSCSFVIRQTTNGGLRVTTVLPTARVLQLQLDAGPQPVRLVGTLGDGCPLTVEGQFLLARSKGQQATFICSGPRPLRIGRHLDGDGTLVALLTNFYFPGTEVIRRSDAVYPGALPLNIGNRVF